MLVRDVPQQLNAPSPMLVTLLGIVMLVSLSQSLNALSPMLVTLLGIVMFVSFSQPKNASFPMLVTLLGIVMLVRDLHQLNASSPMSVTPSGIMQSVMALSLTPVTVLPSSLKIKPFFSASAFMSSPHAPSTSVSATQIAVSRKNFRCFIFSPHFLFDLSV